MAAKFNRRVDENYRQKIKVGMILTRLQNYALGKESDEKSRMSKGQVTAAVALLKKCLPDLINTEVNAHVEGDVKQLIKVSFDWPADIPKPE